MPESKLARTILQSAPEPKERRWKAKERLMGGGLDYLIDGTIFENKLMEYNIKCFDFHYIFGWNISHSRKNWARRDQTHKAY
jgi:hypothetical protein